MISTLGLSVPEDIKYAVNYMLDYHKKNKNDERIIVVITSIDFNDLTTESGYLFLDKFDDKEELAKEIDFLQECYSIDEYGMECYGYRIYNPEKYQMYAVPLNMLKELESKITNAELKPFIEEALRMLHKLKNRNFTTDYHDVRYSDGSFKLVFEKQSEHFSKELEFPATFYPIDFLKERIPQDAEKKIPEQYTQEERIAARICVRIWSAYRQAKKCSMI